MPEVIHVFSEQDSKGILLAEVQRLQSSLAAMRQARDFHGANSAYLMQERDRLQKEIEMSKQQVPCRRCGSTNSTPRWLDATLCGPCYNSQATWSTREILVRKMLDAFRDVEAPDDISMTAVLRVAADALLGPVTDEEWFNKGANRGALDAMLAARRARLLAPAKSVGERVTMEFVSACDEFGWKVFVDHDERGLFKSEQDAQIYRLGLIATLKKESANEPLKLTAFTCTNCGHNVDTHDEEDSGCMVNDCRCAGFAATELKP